MPVHLHSVCTEERERKREESAHIEYHTILSPLQSRQPREGPGRGGKAAEEGGKKGAEQQTHPTDKGSL